MLGFYITQLYKYHVFLGLENFNYKIFLVGSHFVIKSYRLETFSFLRAWW